MDVCAFLECCLLHGALSKEIFIRSKGFYLPQHFDYRVSCCTEDRHTNVELPGPHTKPRVTLPLSAYTCRVFTSDSTIPSILRRGGPPTVPLQFKQSLPPFFYEIVIFVGLHPLN